jgi:hypothetical protein
MPGGPEGYSEANRKGVKSGVAYVALAELRRKSKGVASQLGGVVPP